MVIFLGVLTPVVAAAADTRAPEICSYEDYFAKKGSSTL